MSNRKPAGQRAAAQQELTLPTHTLATRIAEFVQLAPRSKGYTHATMGAYFFWMTTFATWAGEDPAFSEFNEDRIRAFFHDRLIKKEDRPRTINGMISGLRAFGAWCVARGLLPSNPAIVLHRVPLDEPHRNLITDMEAFAMLGACSRYPSARREEESPRAILARAILSVLVWTGIRRAELLALETDDFFESEGRLHIKRGKGGEERDAWLGPQGTAAVAAYLKIRLKDCEHNALFAVRRGQGIGESVLTHLLRETWCLAGLPRLRKVTSHTFRHAFATRLLENDTKLQDTAKLMGHKSVRTTIDIYYHPDRAKLRAAAEKAAAAAVAAVRAALGPDMEALALPAPVIELPQVAPAAAALPALPAAEAESPKPTMQPARARRIDMKANRRLPR